MEQRDNMHNGKLYDPNDDSVMEEQMVCLDRLYDFNQTRPSEMDKRNAIMKEMMGDVGKDCYIEPPFHANWGGKHVHFGDGVYANFGLTCVDDTHIYVGSHTLFGPNVVLATAGHPMMPELRKHGIQYNMPIHIGDKNMETYRQIIWFRGNTCFQEFQEKPKKIQSNCFFLVCQRCVIYFCH